MEKKALVYVAIKSAPQDRQLFQSTSLASCHKGILAEINALLISACA